MHCLTSSNLNFLKHSAFIALCLLHLLSCNGKKKITNNQLPQIKSFIVDSIYIPISENDGPLVRIKEAALPSNKVIAFIRERNYKIYTYDIEKEIYLDSFDISKFRNDFVDFTPTGNDSFLIALEQNKIVLITKNGTKEWNLNFITQKLGKYACLGYQSSEALHVIGDTVMITTSTNEGETNQNGPPINFLRTYYDVIFRLLPDSVQFISMHNPNPRYYYQQDFYGDVERIFINSQKVVYSFSPSDTMLLYDFKNNIEKRTVLNTTNFYKNEPFDYTKKGDYKYVLTYLAEQSRLGIGTLFYNKPKHEIYQLLQHKGNYIDSTGKKQGVEDAAQSLFVLDENLNQLKEVYLPSNSASSLSYYFIANNSLYIGAPKSKQKDHDKMLFYRIVF